MLENRKKYLPDPLVIMIYEEFLIFTQHTSLGQEVFFLVFLIEFRRKKKENLCDQGKQPSKSTPVLK